MPRTDSRTNRRALTIGLATALADAAFAGPDSLTGPGRGGRARIPLAVLAAGALLVGVAGSANAAEAQTQRDSQSTAQVIANAERYAPVTPTGKPTEVPAGTTITTTSGDTSGKLAATGSITEQGRGSVTLTADDARNSIVRQSGIGVQGLTVLHHGNSAGFHFTLPAGQHLAYGPGGSLVITDGAHAIGFIKPGWAIDSTGRQLPSRYDISGDHIKQVVTTTSRTSWPLTLDPWLSWGGPWYSAYVNVNLWKTDVAWVAHSDYWTLLSALCGAISATPAAVACTVFVGAAFIWIKNTMKSVASWGGCYWISFYLPSALNGWRGTFRSMGGFGC